MDYWDFRDHFFYYFTKLGKTANFNYDYVKWLHNKQTSSVRNALPIILKKTRFVKKGVTFIPNWAVAMTE